MDEATLMRAMFDSTDELAVILIGPRGEVLLWNRGAEKITGYARREITGARIDLIYTPSDRSADIPAREISEARKNGRSRERRWHVRKDGTRFWSEGTVTTVRTGERLLGYMKTMEDMTQKHKEQAHMVRLAHSDQLTGLANRGWFSSRLPELTEACLRSDQFLLLHLIDLDHFKEINDTWGHRAGDQVLKQVGQRMQEVIRETDFVARLGGDEFVVLEPNARSPQAGAVLAGKLLAALSRPMAIDGHHMSVGASIGIAVCPQDACEPEDLLHKADLALYRVKEKGRNDYSFFTPGLDHAAHLRVKENVELRRSIEQGMFHIVYQPKLDAHSGRTIALEALLRCDNPLLAPYPIRQVIALAMEAGLMPRIEHWVIREVCRQLRAWKEAGMPCMPTSVNMCAHDLMEAGTPDMVLETLHTFGLEPENVIFEMTEHELAQSKDAGIQVLRDLRASGIRIALDDFGTGYSSLNYLSRLPVDIVKLDQSFLLKVPQEAPSCTLATAVIQLGHALNLEVTAEGVERAEQMQFLAEHGCDATQGFLHCRPLPAQQMADWLRSHA